ncbi:MAG: alpha-glucan family phosphorylase, partial [Chloroflexota bacterium]|nr:alpha-glucan family phosphorylase [Chloroflexota bacterium]
NDPQLRGRVVFIEDYDMNVARHMVAGVDIWLNNPRRPQEASGTSGQKAAMNGAPNFSVLDGWWREAWNGENGWAIGEERDYQEHHEQDEADALSLYATLEEEIIPRYYGGQDKASDNAPWIEVVKESIATITPQFNMQRMVKDYTNLLYIPAQESGEKLSRAGYEEARSLAEWKQYIREQWDGVRIEAEKKGTVHSTVGESLPMSARVYLNGIAPQDVQVEIVTGIQVGDELEDISIHPMTLEGEIEEGVHRYEGEFKPARSGRQAYGIRVVPSNDLFADPMEMGKIRWAEEG